MLFQPPQEEPRIETLILRQTIACAGRLPRSADVFLAGICAEHLVKGLRQAGLIVARPVQGRPPLVTPGPRLGPGRGGPVTHPARPWSVAPAYSRQAGPPKLSLHRP